MLRIVKLVAIAIAVKKMYIALTRKGRAWIKMFRALHRKRIENT